MNIYAFIDSQNLNLAIIEQGWKLDFARFRVYLKDKGKLHSVLIPDPRKFSALLKKFRNDLVFIDFLRKKLGKS